MFPIETAEKRRKFAHLLPGICVSDEKTLRAKWYFFFLDLGFYNSFYLKKGTIIMESPLETLQDILVYCFILVQLLVPSTVWWVYCQAVSLSKYWQLWRNQLICLPLYQLIIIQWIVLEVGWYFCLYLIGVKHIEKMFCMVKKGIGFCKVVLQLNTSKFHFV